MSKPEVADLATKLKSSLKTVTIDNRIFYVGEGDLLIPEDALVTYANERLERQVANPLVAVTTSGLSKLLGIGSNGKLVRWAPEVILTFYIRKESFTDDQYAIVRDNFLQATEQWMSVCGIRFQHLAIQDGNPNTRDGSAMFPVRFIDAKGRFIAAAFFPTDPPDRRFVVVDPSYFTDNGFDAVGVLRHELGHVLGFRHEHIRSLAPPDCPTESTVNTIDITAYDPKSVMHYFCGQVGNPKLEFTKVDREGAANLYGPSFQNFELVAKS